MFKNQRIKSFQQYKFIEKKIIFCLFFVFFAIFSLIAQKYSYESVVNDPFGVRIYTLENGLKVYLSVYKDEPRINCYIAVKVGSKNDPQETTGLAHYFEHLMFKGTQRLGTLDYQKEKSLLDDIEQLFEIYRKEKDPTIRASLYHHIDSLSYIASQYAIPNEYTKMMKFIGSQGTNAATSNDYTIYKENIPANRIEMWAEIEADRFSNPVIRLFHTELETIYEEKNMALTNDGRRSSQAILEALYPNHPYGQQTTLGSQEHLKNPSITNIKQFYDQYYVPNNMAICLSGDFDFEETIAIIDKYFGKLISSPIPVWTPAPLQIITEPIEREIVGLEPENIKIAYQFDIQANSKEVCILKILSNLLSNGTAGLMDIHLIQNQTVNEAGSYLYSLTDYVSLVLYANPKLGQDLEELKKHLLHAMEMIRTGEFSEQMLQATIANLKLREIRQLESNNARVSLMANAFYSNMDWKDIALMADLYSKIRKEDIMRFVKQHINQNYVVVYKKQGEPSDILKIEKPNITPIELNRDAESTFSKELKQNKIKPIKPIFVNFKKEITFSKIANCPLYYVQNRENNTFNLTMRIPIGELNDIRMPLALNYLDFLGTDTKTAETIKQLFYQYACSFNAYSSDDYTQISISGLSDNFEPAVKLAVELIQNVKPDDEVLKHLIDKVRKAKKDAYHNVSSVFNALVAYGEYGADLPKYFINETQLSQLSGIELITIIKQLFSYKTELLYYGPKKIKDVQQILSKCYPTPTKFEIPSKPHKFELQEVNRDSVLFIHFPITQSRLVLYSRSMPFEFKLFPVISLYNQYFGGSMNAIVFQEMREKRSLAYTAQSRFITPPDRNEFMYNYAYIATQNDKVIDALTAFNELFNDMPKSEPAFHLAEMALQLSIETNRITKMNILNTYIRNNRLGVNDDIRKEVYKNIKKMKLTDIISFNETFIKNQPKFYLVLSNEKEFETEKMEKLFGKVNYLKMEDIFGEE